MRLAKGRTEGEPESLGVRGREKRPRKLQGALPPSGEVLRARAAHQEQAAFVPVFFLVFGRNVRVLFEPFGELTVRLRLETLTEMSLHVIVHELHDVLRHLRFTGRQGRNREVHLFGKVQVVGPHARETHEPELEEDVEGTECSVLLPVEAMVGFGSDFGVARIHEEVDCAPTAKKKEKARVVFGRGLASSSSAA